MSIIYLLLAGGLGYYCYKMYQKLQDADVKRNRLWGGLVAVVIMLVLRAIGL